MILDAPLTAAGAVIDVQLGPGPRRRSLLRRHGFPVPPPVRAIIDTGASLSGFAGRVFSAADLTPVTTRKVLTPSTPVDQPYECNLFDVTLYLVANGTAHEFLNALVMAADGWHPAADDGAEGFIGRDVLDRSSLFYYGLDRRFSFGF